MSLRLPCMIGLALILSGSCGGEPPTHDDPASAFSIADSAGIRISSNSFQPPRQPQRAADPELQIGTVDGEPEYQLYQLNGALRDPDERLVVGNSGTAEIRIYRADGTHDLTFGRRGDGPAEFRSPRLLFIRNDTIFVEDLRALVLFDSQGRFLERRSLDLNLLSRLVTSPFEGGGWKDEDTYVVPSTIWEGSEVPEGPFRPPTTFFSVDVTDERSIPWSRLGASSSRFLRLGGG